MAIAEAWRGVVGSPVAEVGSMGRAQGRHRADFISVLEALYAPEPDERAWAGGVIAATEATRTDAVAAGLSVVGHGDDYGDLSPLLIATANMPPEMGDSPEVAILSRFDPNAFRALFCPGPPAMPQSELEPTLPPEMVEVLRAYRRQGGAGDAFGIFAQPEPGVAAVLYWGTAGRCAIDRTERVPYRRIAHHLDAALRLRLRPEQAVAAVLAPSGALLDLEHEELAPRRQSLASRVTRIERTRLRARRTEPDATEQWEALVGGRYTLVPREDRDGKRYYLLVVNPPGARKQARWSAREAEVVRLAARGFNGKESAYALGLSPGTVSDALGGAAAKVGLRSRVELARVAAAMFRPGAGEARGGGAGEALSAAEREVLSLLRRGLSNAEIARLRDRSVRTVANQVSSLLAKTGSPSRRALAARATEE